MLIRIQGIVVFNSDYAGRVFNIRASVCVFFSLFIVSSIGYSEGFSEREITTEPIEIIPERDGYKYIFSVCGPKLYENDLIFVVSDSSIIPLHIDKNIKLEPCTAFDIKILAIDPTTIKTEIIKIEDKSQQIQLLENKIISLENIIKRISLDLEETLNKTMLDDADKEMTTNMMSRILDLYEYQSKIQKKLNVILNI